MTKTIAGFTGTRNGMTEAQKVSFLKLIGEIRPIELHHGCCDGADEDAVNLLYPLKHTVFIAHPGVSAGELAVDKPEDKKSIKQSQVVFPVRTHFRRNRDIVDVSTILIATPWQTKDNEPIQGEGGGTWYTIQYAVKVGKPVCIIWPDGTVESR